MAQKGWITKQKRKKQVAVWVYHWYVTKPETGKKVEHTRVVGSISHLATEEDAWREIDRRQLQPKPNQSEVPPGGPTWMPNVP